MSPTLPSHSPRKMDPVMTPRLLVPWCAVALLACGAPPASALPDAGGGQDAGAPDAGGADAGAPDAGDRCAAITRSVQEAGFGDKVQVSCDGTYAYLAADTYPDHARMTGITGTNDQVPVPAPGYRTPVPLRPVRAAQVTTIDAAVGVAVNGVPIYDYTSQNTNDLSTYDPKFDTKLTGELDACNGHSGRGDDYHYHASPTCMVAAMANKGPGAILGWGLDGYPLYGNTAPDGSVLPAGALDVCNAMADPAYGYRYHTSDGHPYIIQCLVGQVDLAKAPRVPPMDRKGGGGKPPGSKPPGGVTGLQLQEAPDGTRTMTYQHGGQSYSIRYKPSATAGYWDFEEKSYTTGGVLQSNTYCRKPFP